MGKVDAVIRWFMPKEERFHELFAKDTANLLRAAKLFADFSQGTSIEVRRVKRQLRANRELREGTDGE